MEWQSIQIVGASACVISPQILISTNLCLSTELCCVLAGFPHLLFAWAYAGAHRVIPNSHIFAHLILGFMVQGENNKGRCTNSLAQCHPIQTNWCPNSIIPTILHQMLFLLQPFHFILACGDIKYAGSRAQWLGS